MSDSKPYDKVASFTKKPGIAQIASYAVFTFEVALFFIVVLPNLSTNSQIALGVLYSLSLLALIVTAGTCSVVDPSDKVMILYRNDRSE